MKVGFKTRFSRVAVAASAALLASAPLTPALARVTRGDAQAIFEAFAGGGWAVRLHSEVMEGAPADFQPPESLARITTVPALNGKHYCGLDWHVINTAIIEGNRENEAASVSEIFERLATRDVSFRLDGAVLETVRTQPKRMLNPALRSLTEAFYVNIGRIMAPEDLSVGSHSLRAFDKNGNQIGAITFFIDDSGTGACLASESDALTFRVVP